MDTQQLQLAIIRKVIQLEDPEILGTLLKVLQLSENQVPNTAAAPMESNDPFLGASTEDLDAATKEIQQSINDVFNN